MSRVENTFFQKPSFFVVNHTPFWSFMASCFFETTYIWHFETTYIWLILKFENWHFFQQPPLYSQILIIVIVLMLVIAEVEWAQKCLVTGFKNKLASDHKKQNLHLMRDERGIDHELYDELTTLIQRKTNNYCNYFN